MAQVPQVGLGLLPAFREMLFRARMALPRPRYTDQAARVSVEDPTGPMTPTFLTSFVVGQAHAELYGFLRNGDIEALLSIYYDETTAQYVFGVSRNVWDPLSVYFDGAIVGVAPTFPEVTADMTPSIGYVTFRSA